MTKQYFNEDQAAEFLGVARSTLWFLRKNRGLPYMKMGPKFIRYERGALEGWLDGFARREEIPDDPQKS
jgi:predicted DNA-binding transcriptional regulator AlpA